MKAKNTTKNRCWGKIRRRKKKVNTLSLFLLLDDDDDDDDDPLLTYFVSFCIVDEDGIEDVMATTMTTTTKRRASSSSRRSSNSAYSFVSSLAFDQKYERDRQEGDGARAVERRGGGRESNTRREREGRDAEVPDGGVSMDDEKRVW